MLATCYDCLQTHRPTHAIMCFPILWRNHLTCVCPSDSLRGAGGQDERGSAYHDIKAKLSCMLHGREGIGKRSSGLLGSHVDVGQQ